MGTLHDTSDNLLLQTLSKKVLSSSGLTGSKVMMLDSETGDYEVGIDFNVSGFAMCGAFIHALEDEYRVVRGAAVGT